MATSQFKCPRCGGAMEFDPTMQLIKCPYCDSTYQPSEIEALETESNTEGQAYWGNKPKDDNTNFGTTFGEEADELVSYICASCGGEVVGNKTLGAALCPYCGNPVVVNKQFAGDFQPDYILPFAKVKDEALEAYNKFIAGKHFVPNEFKLKSFSDRICGLYIPFWLYDAHVSGTGVFECTNERTWSDGEYDYTETETYEVVRSGEDDFYKVPADAFSQMDDTLMDAIEPYDWSALQPFNTGYLAGFLAHKYDVTKEDDLNRAEIRMKNTFLDGLKSDAGFGYDSCRLVNSDVDFSNEKAHYALLPLWFLKTKYKEKDYYFAMNGQTGQMKGTVPVSNAKATLWWLLFAILGAVAVFAIGYMLRYFVLDTRSIATSLGIGAVGSLIPNLIARAGNKVRGQSAASRYEDSQSFNIVDGHSFYRGTSTSRTRRNH